MVRVTKEVANAADACGVSGKKLLEAAARNLTCASYDFFRAASGLRSLAESSTSGRDDGDLLTDPLLRSCQGKNGKMTDDDLEASNHLSKMRNSAADSDPLQQSASREIKESSLSEKYKKLLSYGLLGGLALLPYLGSGLRKTVSPCSPSVFHYIFSSWWICIGVGVVCSSSGRAMCRNIWGLILAVYSQVASRLAMFGITMLVILYSHLELAPSETIGLYILWWVATFLHLVVWIADHMNRETEDIADR